jgi:hypothetical protein
MLKKLHVHTRNVPGSYGKSVENFIIEQSLEEAITKESSGETSGANPAKLPKDQIGKQRLGFLSEIWKALKDFFFKIVDWFKEKLQWIADKIGKRPTTSESVQILSSCTNEEAKDIWDTLLEYDIDASKKSSDKGKVICISNAAIKKFSANVEKFDIVGHRLVDCAQTVEKQGGYLASNNSSNLSYNNILANVNGLRSQIAEFIPGAKQVPEQIQKLTKEDITKFNRQFKDCLSYLKWDHDPEGYAKFFTGSNLIKKAGANAASVAAAQYGTTNPSELRKLIPSLTETLKTIETTLTQLRKDVDVADKSFNKYISKQNLIDNQGNLKEYQGGDENYANAVIVYQFATTTMTCFKMINKLIQIAIDVHKQMNDELVKLTNVLDKAAKFKKERKWFQFKKKDRDAKKVNDTYKEAGLDTENEEEVDKRNANWDKLENFEKGAKKVGKKIGKGVSAAGEKIGEFASGVGESVSQTINDAKQNYDEAKVRRHLEKKDKDDYKQREKAAKEQEKADARTAREQEKADARTAKEQEKADARTARDAAKAAKEQEKADARTARDAAKAAKKQEKADARTARDAAKAAKEAAETKRQSDFSKALHEAAMAEDVKKYNASNTVRSFADYMSDLGYNEGDISKARGMLSWNPYTLDSFIKQKSREDWLLNPENYI